MQDAACDTPRCRDGRGIFVTGTDTDVGKTAVAVAILRQCRAAGICVGAYKPVASGCRPGVTGDAERLWQAAGRPRSVAEVCPQSFVAALAPSQAAAAMGRTIDEALLISGFDRWQRSCAFTVVEGAGGLFSPLSEHLLNVDLAVAYRLPLVVVDAARLGAIGRTLATVTAARARGLVVAAVVLSATSPPVVDATGPHRIEPSGAIIPHALAEIAARLPGVAVGLLAHAADAVHPMIDWPHLASLNGSETPPGTP